MKLQSYSFNTENYYLFYIYKDYIYMYQTENEVKDQSFVRTKVVVG